MQEKEGEKQRNSFCIQKITTFQLKACSIMLLYYDL